MSNVRGVAVAAEVLEPLVLGGVRVSSADVAGLEGFEVLEGAKFIGHWFFG